MQNIRKVTIIAATFLLAAATGHVMQTSQVSEIYVPSAPKRVTGASAAPSINVTGFTISDVAALPKLPQRPVGSEVARSVSALPTEPADVGFAAADCPPAKLDLATQPGALLAVAITAPCAARKSARLQLDALEFDLNLDGAGKWSGLVPALGTDNRVEVRLPDDVRLSAKIAAPGTVTFNRTLVLWQGVGAVHLNAYEYGAHYGEAGHVRADMPRTPDTPLGGYLMSYGAKGSGAHAEVYSAPADMNNIRFDLEAPVSAASCGRDLRASVVKIQAGAASAPLPVTLSMPDCDLLDGSVVMDLPETMFSVAAAN